MNGLVFVGLMLGCAAWFFAASSRLRVPMRALWAVVGAELFLLVQGVIVVVAMRHDPLRQLLATYSPASLLVGVWVSAAALVFVAGHVSSYSLGASPEPASIAVLRRLETALVCVLLLSMVGVAALRIVVRVGRLKLDIMWSDAYLKHSVLWITVLGAALATRDRNHVNIDVVGRLLKGRWRAGCQALTDLFAAVVCGVVAWACYVFVLSQQQAFAAKSFSTAGTIFGSVPAWYAQAVMPVAFALMTVRFLVQTVEDAVALWRGSPPPGREGAPAAAGPANEAGGEP